MFSGGFFTGTWFWRGPRNSGFWTPSQEFFAGIPTGQEFLYLVRIPPDSSGFLQDSCSRQIYGTTNEFLAKLEVRPFLTPQPGLTMASAARCPRSLLAPLWHAHRHTFVVVCCLCRRCVCCPSTTLRPCRPDHCPNSCPPSQRSSLLSRRLLCSRCLAQSCMQDWLIVVWKASIHALPHQSDHRSPPLGSCRCLFLAPLHAPVGPIFTPSLSSSHRHPCCGRVMQQRR